MNTSRDITARLLDLLRREHAALGEFLVALADFDRERRWIELGHASLFSFLHRELGLSKGAAFYRKTAAELVQRYPEVIEPLRDGRLCITSVVELAKVITPENRGTVVSRFFHRSKQEAKELAAELRPVPVPARREVITVVRRQGSASGGERGADADADADAGAGAGAGAGARDDQASPVVNVETRHGDLTCPAVPGLVGPRVQPDEPAGTVSAERARRRDSIEPLDADLRRLHLTVSRRFLDKLAAARDALSHSHPGAGTEDVLEAALDLVLAARAKRRGLVAKPRREKETAGGLTEASSGEGLPPAQRREREAIPAHVRREVWTRDAARCQWPLASGGICGSTHRLELDHLLPVARGGASTAENLRVLCRPHNLVAARAAFGKPWMDGFARGERGAGAGVWSGCVRRESGGAGSGSGAGADAIAPRVRRGVHAG